MMKSIPTISRYMSTVPVTVGPHVTLHEAQKIMRDNNIRHLPVLDGGAIVGIISERDLKTFSALKGVDFRHEKVSQAATLDPLAVGPTAKLDEVCTMMAEHKYGCVLIQDNSKIVGIFTWVDALNAMGDLLETRLKK